MFKKIKNSKYKWEVKENFSVRILSLKECEFQGSVKGKNNNIIVDLNEDIVTICSGYQFDGCSCSPDFKKALLGCCIHDALIQFLDIHPTAFSIEDAHEAMFQIHKSSRFKLARVYYAAVSSWLGKVYIFIKNRIKFF